MRAVLRPAVVPILSIWSSGEPFKKGALILFILSASCSFDFGSLQGGHPVLDSGVGGRGGIGGGGTSGLGGTGGRGDAGAPDASGARPEVPVGGAGGGAGGTPGGGSTSSSSCPTGAETCSCYIGEICNPGLTCASHLCVNLGAGGSGGDRGGGGGTTIISTTGGTTTISTGGTATTTTRTTPSGGGTAYASTTGASSFPTGGTTGVTTGVAPSGTTVTFASGKAAGAMTGLGWVALGTADTISSPTCGTATITNAAPCLTSTTWSSTTALCITGSVPALPAAPTSTDYSNNWGVSVGVNATDTTPSGGLGQSFSSVTITVSGSPSSGLRAMVHRKGDADATSYCATLTSGTAMPLTSFSTTCYTPASPGTAITATDVPNIDLIGVQVSSGTAAITVSNLCITGITFAQ